LPSRRTRCHDRYIRLKQAVPVGVEQGYHREVDLHRFYCNTASTVPNERKHHRTPVKCSVLNVRYIGVQPVLTTEAGRLRYADDLCLELLQLSPDFRLVHPRFFRGHKLGFDLGQHLDDGTHARIGNRLSLRRDQSHPQLQRALCCLNAWSWRSTTRQHCRRLFLCGGQSLPGFVSWPCLSLRI